MAMARRGKRQLNVWLSADAYEGWQLMVTEANVESLTAMVEAVGRAASRNRGGDWGPVAGGLASAHRHGQGDRGGAPVPPAPPRWQEQWRNQWRIVASPSVQRA